jgi:hypothetical protein
MAFAVLLALSGTNCVAALGALAGLGEGLAAQDERDIRRMAASGGAEKAYIFGGEGHTTYLGCLCGTTGAESIFNSASPFGSSVGGASILNHYGEYGSAYSTHSACNPLASDPPVIIRGAQILGRLTLNRSIADVVRDPQLVAWLTAQCNT